MATSSTTHTAAANPGFEPSGKRDSTAAAATHSSAIITNALIV
jgi:hypothetical protein